MQTAYALHFSEGVPERVLVKTEVHDNKMSVTISKCDWTWAEDIATRRGYEKLLKKAKFFRPEPEVMFHAKFRRKMEIEYNWRFEVYHPFSDDI